MKEPEIKPEVELIGQDGNAFAILSKVIKALKDAGADVEYVNKYQEEATSGDYDNLLRVTMQYVDVY
jgi:menaquinone-dependent protoporphyrinogen IX oxidase